MAYMANELITDCLSCAENGTYKCTKCDGEMYYKATTSNRLSCDECEDKNEQQSIIVSG